MLFKRHVIYRSQVSVDSGVSFDGTFSEGDSLQGQATVGLRPGSALCCFASQLKYDI